MTLPWKQRIANRLTCVVLALQAAVLLTFWVTPSWMPPDSKFLELLWAWMHRPTFYPVVALIIGGPLLSVMAWCCRGRHRLWLVAGWLVLAAVLLAFYDHRIGVMLRALWWIWLD